MRTDFAQALPCIRDNCKTKFQKHNTFLVPNPAEYAQAESDQPLSVLQTGPYGPTAASPFKAGADSPSFRDRRRFVAFHSSLAHLTEAAIGNGGDPTYKANSN